MPIPHKKRFSRNGYLPSREVKTMRVYKIALCLLSLLGIAACGHAIEQFDLSGESMGTTYKVKVIGKRIDTSELKQKIEDEFEKINNQMSTWQKNSEISRFNRDQTIDWFKISDEFMLVLDASQKINRQTEGAFDVTVGGIVNLWGFGSSPRRSKVPEPDAIVERLSHVGPATFEINLSTVSIRKFDPKTQLDLSGIAKGYAVDAVVEILAEAKIKDFLVEIGGEVRAAGRRLDESAWRVAIEKPVNQSRSILLTVSLEDAALATSGDYRDYFEIGVKRYSHIIDPRTGNPPDNSVASVSVVSDEAMYADALATGLMVLGTDKALALAAKNNLAVMIIEREGSRFRVFQSNAFEALHSIQSH